MENYKINSKLKIYEDIKNIYYAKPDKTLAQHNEELHIQKKKLINLGYLSDEKLIELLEYSIEFHDIGKINSEFQIRVKENKKFEYINNSKYEIKVTGEAQNDVAKKVEGVVRRIQEEEKQRLRAEFGGNYTQAGGLE